MGDTIWILRDPSGEKIGAGLSYYTALQEAKVVHVAPFGPLRALENMAENDRGDRHEHDGYTLTREPLPAPAPADAAGVIPQYVRDGWRREKGNGMTSAVGEYTPAEFWTLLDAYERLLTAARGRGGA